jgi:hypothetical protein
LIENFKLIVLGLWIGVIIGLSHLGRTKPSMPMRHRLRRSPALASARA